MDVPLSIVILICLALPVLLVGLAEADVRITEITRELDAERAAREDVDVGRTGSPHRYGITRSGGAS